MAAHTAQGRNLLNGWKRAGRFDSELGSRLPEAYKKFWREWKIQLPAAVHYIPKDGMFERNEVTGKVTPVQNVPIPLKKIPQENEGIWGGEAVIQGFQKRNAYKRRVPHFWVPTLKRTVLKSEILNEFFSVTVTSRTVRLILEHHGFDHYLLKTPACDLRSLLALRIKKKILADLDAGCPSWADNPNRQNEITAEYKKYLAQYTPEEIEWYGLTFEEALMKMRKMVDAENEIVPHKIIFRKRLIEQLKEVGIAEAQDVVRKDASSGDSTSWVQKINPFSKKEA